MVNDIKLNKRDLRLLSNLSKEYAKLYKTLPLCGINVHLGYGDVHITFESFVKTFDKEDVGVYKNNSEEFPYEVSAYVDDIKFLALATEDKIIDYYPEFL